MYDVSLYVCVFICLFVCLLLLKSMSMFSLVPHVPLSLFSVLECDVYVQLKKGNEITEHISAA